MTIGPCPRPCSLTTCNSRLDEAARAQNRQPVEILTEALRQYLKNRKWENLVSRAERRNAANGLVEGDVPGKVAEYRAENQERSR